MNFRNGLKLLNSKLKNNFNKFGLSKILDLIIISNKYIDYFALIFTNNKQQQWSYQINLNLKNKKLFVLELLNSLFRVLLTLLNLVFQIKF